MVSNALMTIVDVSSSAPFTKPPELCSDTLIHHHYQEAEVERSPGSPVKCLPHLPAKAAPGEGLLKEARARLQHSAVSESAVGMA